MFSINDYRDMIRGWWCFFSSSLKTKYFWLGGGPKTYWHLKFFCTISFRAFYAWFCKRWEGVKPPFSTYTSRKTIFFMFLSSITAMTRFNFKSREKKINVLFAYKLVILITINWCDLNDFFLYIFYFLLGWHLYSNIEKNHYDFFKMVDF